MSLVILLQAVRVFHCFEQHCLPSVLNNFSDARFDERWPVWGY